MNENIDLTKILKDCPKGTELWSDNYGIVKFVKVGTEYDDTPIKVELANGCLAQYTKEGWWNKHFPANCLLWSSKDCRDWSKFTAPWYKKEKFDPKTLKAFDRVRVLVRDTIEHEWRTNLFSHYYDKDEHLPCRCIGGCAYRFCIPYNDDTKHLVGTTDEAPEYYRYWED